MRVVVRGRILFALVLLVLCLGFLSLLLFAGLLLGQPVTVIGVDWCFSAPFWPTNAVGISRRRGLCRLDVAHDGLLVALDPHGHLLLDGRGLREGAEVAVGREGGVGLLGERQFEARDGLVGDGVEGAAGDPCFADERVAVRSIVKP